MMVSGSRGSLEPEQPICQPLHLFAALQQIRREAATMFADEEANPCRTDQLWRYIF
jgi:hypothetical protein